MSDHFKGWKDGHLTGSGTTAPATQIKEGGGQVLDIRNVADGEILTRSGNDIIGTLLSVYPVGSIYISVLPGNPQTLFGGTWVAFGEGRVLVGKAASGTFDTAGATGGAETHTLTVNEMPSHTHTQNAHSHTAPTSSSGSATGTARLGGSNDTIVTSSVTATNQNTGGSEAHNNLQPYIVVYMWQRTA